MSIKPLEKNETSISQISPAGASRRSVSSENGGFVSQQQQQQQLKKKEKEREREKETSNNDKAKEETWSGAT